MSLSTEQKFVVILSTAVLFLVFVIGGCVTSWLFYLIYRKQVHFPTNHFATLALGSDLILCTAGALVLTGQNLLLLAAQPSIKMLCVSACVLGLAIILFHVLMTSTCFILEHISSTARRLDVPVGISGRKLRRLGLIVACGASCGTPIVFLILVSVDRNQMMGDYPSCSADEFFLPVVFVCFASILVTLSSALVMAYRIRNSRRVVAVNLRTDIIHTQSHGREQSRLSTISTGINCSIQSHDPTPGSRNSSKGLSSKRRTTTGLCKTDRLSNYSQPEITISVQANSAVYEPDSEAEVRRASPCPARKFALAKANATSCVSTDQDLPPLAINWSVCNDTDIIQTNEKGEDQSTRAVRQQQASQTCCTTTSSELKPPTISQSSLPPARSETLRLSLVSTVSEYSRSHPVSVSAPAQRTAMAGSDDTLDLSYSTVSWFTVGVLLLVFIMHFATSLFLTDDTKSTVYQALYLVLYVAAAVRPLLYVRSRKSLWKKFVTPQLNCCVCGDANIVMA